MFKRLKRGVKILLKMNPVTPHNSGVAYFHADQMLREASAKNQGLEQYTESQWGVVGAVKDTIDKIEALDIMPDGKAFLEMGPGTGNYLKRTLEVAKPSRYEIYETAADWRAYLAKQYDVVAPVADGSSLAQTADESIAFLQAHGVFQAINAVVSYEYFREIRRVCQKGAHVVFDFCPVETFDPDTWLASPHRYPHFLSREQVVQWFEKNGFELVTQFEKKWLPIDTLYLVFRKIS